MGPLLINYEDLSFLGDYKLDKELAVKICRGEIDPIRRLAFTENIEDGPQKMMVYQKGGLTNKKPRKERGGGASPK